MLVPSTGHWVTVTAGPYTVTKLWFVLQGDKGGERVLQKKWTTFLKAQLLCSLPDDGFPFNIIQDMFVLTPSPEDWKNTVFYGVFTSQWWGNTLSRRHTVHMQECVGFSIDLGNEIFCVWVGWYYTHLLNNISHTWTAHCQFIADYHWPSHGQTATPPCPLFVCVLETLLITYFILVQHYCESKE